VGRPPGRPVGQRAGGRGGGVGGAVDGKQAVSHADTLELPTEPRLFRPFTLSGDITPLRSVDGTKGPANTTKFVGYMGQCLEVSPAAPFDDLNRSKDRYSR